jgi:hypothetical protein
MAANRKCDWHREATGPRENVRIAKGAPTTPFDFSRKAALTPEERERLAQLLEKARIPDPSLTNGTQPAANPQKSAGSVH